MIDQSRQSRVFYVSPPGIERHSIGVGIPLKKDRRHLVGIFDLRYCVDQGQNHVEFLRRFYNKVETIEHEGTSAIGLVCQIKVDDALPSTYLQDFDRPGNQHLSALLGVYRSEIPEPIIHVTRKADGWGISLEYD